MADKAAAALSPRSTCPPTGRLAGGSISRSVQRVQTVFGGLIPCPAFAESGDNEIGVSADPESNDCILSVKLGPCAASGRGGNSGSVGHCWSTWTLGAVAQPVKSSVVVSSNASFLTFVTPSVSV